MYSTVFTDMLTGQPHCTASGSLTAVNFHCLIPIQWIFFCCFPFLWWRLRTAFKVWRLNDKLVTAGLCWSPTTEGKRVQREQPERRNQKKQILLHPTRCCVGVVGVIRGLISSKLQIFDFLSLINNSNAADSVDTDTRLTIGASNTVTQDC